MESLHQKIKFDKEMKQKQIKLYEVMKKKDCDEEKHCNLIKKCMNKKLKQNRINMITFPLYLGVIFKVLKIIFIVLL